MINKVGQVMLYVDNQDEAVDFWIELVGFSIVSEEDNGNMRWIEVAPTEDAATSLVLHDKATISKMSPELNLGTPSLMFYSDHFDELHDHLVANDVTVGEVVKMPTGRIFNFSDRENNYFAVMEKTTDKKEL